MLLLFCMFLVWFSSTTHHFGILKVLPIWSKVGVHKRKSSKFLLIDASNNVVWHRRQNRILFGEFGVEIQCISWISLFTSTHSEFILSHAVQAKQFVFWFVQIVRASTQIFIVLTTFGLNGGSIFRFSSATQSRSLKKACERICVSSPQPSRRAGFFVMNPMVTINAKHEIITLPFIQIMHRPTPTFQYGNSLARQPHRI